MQCDEKGEEVIKKTVMEQAQETTTKRNQDINEKKRNRKHKCNGSLRSRCFYSF